MATTATGGGGALKPPSTPLLLLFQEPPRKSFIRAALEKYLPAIVIFALCLYLGLVVGFNLPPLR